MRSKIKMYFLAGLAVLAVALIQNMQGGPFATAFATAGGYAGHDTLSPESLRLLKAARYRPDSFLKVTAGEVRAFFAEPELVRAELPTLVWQYRTEACVLDLYFEAHDMEDAKARVVHYEIRPRSEEMRGYGLQKECVRSLAARQGGPRMVDVSRIYKRP